MREIKVSVIIPIYNVEEYLEECLQSVVDQTLEDLQVIMVDDGSLDGSTDTVSYTHLTLPTILLV